MTSKEEKSTLTFAEDLRKIKDYKDAWRCARCGWPPKEEKPEIASAGCRRGDCATRPDLAESNYCDLERYKREQEER